VLSHTYGASMAQHNTNLKRAPFKRSILGNLAQLGPSMPCTVGKPGFQWFFWYMSLKRIVAA
jgi:hypothetical protein